MSYGTSRAALTASIVFRLNDARSGNAVRWTSSDIDEAIDEALLFLPPLGDEVLIEMTGAQYIVIPQQPVASVLEIKRIEADAAQGKWGTLERGSYLLQHQATKWLTLRNTPLPLERLRISAVTEYPQGAATITADTEVVILYALAVLYERVMTFGLTGSRKDDAVEALNYRTAGDIRKQSLVMQMYPPPPDAPKPPKK